MPTSRGSEKLVGAILVAIVILLIAAAIIANAVFGTKALGAFVPVTAFLASFKKPVTVVKKRIGDGEIHSGGVHRAANRGANVKNSDGTPLWKKHAEEGPTDSGRTMVLLLIVAIVAIIILAGYLVGVALRPQPRTLYSQMEIASGDVKIINSTPSGDNRTAIVTVEVEMANVGEAESGVISVWCEAFELKDQAVRVSYFNASDLRPLDGSASINKVPPKGKSGSIVKATGTLQLPPGNYTTKLKLYEDYSKRTVVYGSMLIYVKSSMVANQTEYNPEGSARGRSEPEPAQSSGAFGAPGFEVPAVLAAAVAVALLLRPSRK